MIRGSLRLKHFIAGCMALAVSGASAFSNGVYGNARVGWFFEANHEYITEKALSGPFENAPGKLPFNKYRIPLIQTQNSQVDSRELEASAHFDDEDFVLSNARIDRLANSVVLNSQTHDFYRAAVDLARALHTLQDFYAHSTWVETHGGVPNRALGRLDVALPNPSPAESNCTQSQWIAGSALTSGYWAADNRMFLTRNRVWYTDPYVAELGWPTAKCVHGYDKYGVNKDSSSQPNFVAARDAAIAASHLFVDRILGRLTKTEACGLLGQEKSVACWDIVITAARCELMPGDSTGRYKQKITVNGKALGARGMFVVATESRLTEWGAGSQLYYDIPVSQTCDSWNGSRSFQARQGKVSLCSRRIFDSPYVEWEQTFISPDANNGLSAELSTSDLNIDVQRLPRTTKPRLECPGGVIY